MAGVAVCVGGIVGRVGVAVVAQGLVEIGRIRSPAEQQHAGREQGGEDGLKRAMEGHGLV